MFQQLIKIRRLLRTLRDHLLKLGEKEMMIYFKAASIKYLSHENTVEDALIKDLVNPTNFNLMVGKLGDVLIKALDLPLGYAINWGRIWSLWPVHLETACCSVEFGAASGPRYDVERFGIIEAFGSLRQCDLIVVQGTVTRKMAPRLRMVYDQMPEPKYVIAMGACAITGGLYIDSYNVLPGIDGIVPVDVYVPGCPPRPETLIQGCMLLQEKIKRSKIR
jgi:NADH-quinone oxidoreductase subunit B